MKDLVIDASVVLKWFRVEGETHFEAARALRDAYGAGLLVVHAPAILKLEIVNIAGRRWGWDGSRLIGLVELLGDLGITYAEPDPGRIAHWTAAGLTAYDASYVAVAEDLAVPLVTDDARILEVAPSMARSLLGAADTLLADASDADDGMSWPRSR